MDSQYLPLSASIHLDFPPPPRSLEALYNPKRCQPRRSRILFHETVHFWQYLNSGYLMRLVDEDWSRLTHFESTGERRRDAPRRRHYRLPHPNHGMAPRDLVELFVRFWDVQVVGPPDLLAMEIEEGRAKAQIVERYRAFERDGLFARHPEHGGYSWESFELARRAPAAAGRSPMPPCASDVRRASPVCFFPSRPLCR